MSDGIKEEEPSTVINTSEPVRRNYGRQSKNKFAAFRMNYLRRVSHEVKEYLISLFLKEAPPIWARSFWNSKQRVTRRETAPPISRILANCSSAR